MHDGPILTRDYDYEIDGHGKITHEVSVALSRMEDLPFWPPKKGLTAP